MWPIMNLNWGSSKLLMRCWMSVQCSAVGNKTSENISNLCLELSRNGFGVENEATRKLASHKTHGIRTPPAVASDPRLQPVTSLDSYPPFLCAAADNSSTLQQSREWPVFIQQWSANYTPHWSHPGTPYMISSILAADHTNPQVTLSGQLAPLSDFEMMVYQVLLEHYLSSYQVSWFPGTINSVQCKTWQGIIIDEHTWLTPPTPHNHCNVNALSRDDQSWMN